ncbi:hypothetical protein NPIL_634351 [Nephila pilipes]|uniref:C2H2-type domain-containing protein n=1 Tax=Nephila pilipes TaxID=299642 RepID=A0A8X6MC09_NEPPI|nr:hypothetical protein NPIL_634351 [Nephila pilipes]
MEATSAMNSQFGKEVIDHLVSGHRLSPKADLLVTSVTWTRGRQFKMTEYGYYECIFCNKALETAMDRYNHICIGKWKVGFHCDYCLRIFKTRLPFVRHLMRHYSLV